MSDWKFEAKDFGHALGADRECAAEDANAKLKQWIDASQAVDLVDDTDSGCCYWVSSEDKGPSKKFKTHTARLICMEPIKQETAEDILQELVERWKCSSYSQYDGPFVTQLALRAAKLLENK